MRKERSITSNLGNKSSGEITPPRRAGQLGNSNRTRAEGFSNLFTQQQQQQKNKNRKHTQNSTMNSIFGACQHQQTSSAFAICHYTAEPATQHYLGGLSWETVSQSSLSKLTKSPGRSTSLLLPFFSLSEVPFSISRNWSNRSSVSMEMQQHSFLMAVPLLCNTSSPLIIKRHNMQQQQSIKHEQHWHSWATTTTYTQKVAAAAEAKHDTTQHKKSQTKTVREVKHTQRQTDSETER